MSLDIKYKNIKGLSAQDRADWEKENLEVLSNAGYYTLQDNEKNNIFKSWALKSKFGHRDDYASYFKNLKGEQIDSVFNTLDKDDSMSVLPTYKEAKENTVYDLDRQGQNYESKWLELDDFLKKNSKTYRDWGNEYLWKWGSTNNNKVKEIIINEYNADTKTFGEEVAKKNLLNKIQTVISHNQPLVDKIGKGLMGFNATMVGALVNSVGFIMGAVTSPVAQAINGGWSPDERANFGQQWLIDIADNPLSRLGNKMIKTGKVFNDEEDDKNIYEIIRTAEELNGGQLDYFISENTIPELMQQAGFTVAAAIEGIGLGSLVKQGFKQAAKQTIKKIAKETTETTAKKEAMKVALENYAKWQNRVNAVLVPGMVGSFEGAINALEAKDASLASSRHMIEQGLKDIVDKEYQKRRQVMEIPEEAKNNPQIIQLMEKALYNKTNIEISQMMADKLQDVEKEAVHIANKTLMYDLAIESVINGLINRYLQSSQFGKEVKNSIKRTSIGKKFIFDKIGINEADKVIANKIGIPKKIFNSLKEVTGEGFEEYFQELNRETTVAGGEYNMYHYLQQKFNNEAEEGLIDSFAGALSSAGQALGETWASKESIRAFILGALSSAGGTINVQGMTSNEKGRFNDFKNQSAWQKTKNTASHIVHNLYRNPMLDSWRSDNAENNSREETAKALDAWLNKEGNKDKLTSIRGVLGWINEMGIHEENGDEFSYRNSVLGKQIQQYYMLEHLKGTKFYDAWMDNQLNILQASEGSELAKEIVQFDSRPLAEIQAEVKKSMDLMKSIQEETNNIEKYLGESVPQLVKETLVFGKLSYNNFQSRRDKLNKEIDAITQSILKEQAFSSTKMSKEQISHYIQYGNLDITKAEKELMKIYDTLTNDIKVLEENKDDLTPAKKKELKEKKKEKEKLQKEIKKIESDKIKRDTISETEGYYFSNNPDLMYLSASDILALPEEQRAKILNEKNKSRYSERQQQEIEYVIKSGLMQDADFNSKIQDVARLKIAQENYLDQYTEALQSPKRLQDIYSVLQYTDRYDLRKKEINEMLKLSSYEDFVDAYTRFRGKTDVSTKEGSIDMSLAQSILKNNPFYKQFQQQSEKVKSIYSHIEANSKLTNMSKDDKNVVVAAINYLVRKGVDIDNFNAIISAFSEINNEGVSSIVEFINHYNELVEDESKKLKLDNIHEVLGILKEVIQSNIENKKQVQEIKEEKKPGPIERKDTPTQPVANQVEDNKEKKVFNISSPHIIKMLNYILKEAEKESSFTEILSDFKDYLHKVDSIKISNLNNVVNILLDDSKLYLKNSENPGDKNYQLSLLLKKSAEKLQQNKDKFTPPTFNPVIDNNVVSLQFTADENNTFLTNLFKNWNIQGFLLDNKVTGETKIFFTTIENDGIYYVVALVEHKDGPIFINDKHYQPIGIVPKNNEHPGISKLYNQAKDNVNKLYSEGNLNLIAYTENSGGVISEGIEVSNDETTDTPVKKVLENSMTSEEKESYNNELSKNTQSTNIFLNAFKIPPTLVTLKQKFINGLRAIRDKNKNIALVYFHKNASTKKDGFYSFVFVNDIVNTKNRNGNTIYELLDSVTEGSEDIILDYNVFIKEFTKALKDISKYNYTGLTFDSSGNLITENIEDEKAKHFIENLPKILNRYLYTNLGEYKLKVTNGKVHLYLTQSDKEINLGPIIDSFDNTTGLVSSITNKELFDVLYNLFYDENKAPRKGITWNIPKPRIDQESNDPVELSEADKKIINESIDDGVLRMSANRMDATVKSINITLPNGYKDTTAPSSVPTGTINDSMEDNAHFQDNNPQVTSSSGETIDPVTGLTTKGEIPKNPPAQTPKQRAEEIVKKMKENTSKFTRGEGYYENTESKKRTSRVTDLITEDSEVSKKDKTIESEEIKENKKLVSTTIGNSIDKFLRDVFKNIKNAFENYKNYGYATKNQYKNLQNQVEEWKIKQEREKNLTFVSDEITVSGTIEMFDPNTKSFITEEVTGTIDMLAYDDNGNFYLYDFKTFRSEDSLEDNLRKYTLQLSVYKKLLEQKYGITVKELAIIPISVDYVKVTKKFMYSQNDKGEVGYNVNLPGNKQIFKPLTEVNPKMHEVKYVQEQEIILNSNVKIEVAGAESAVLVDVNAQNETIDNNSTITPSENENKLLWDDLLPMQKDFLLQMLYDKEQFESLDRSMQDTILNPNCM